jgi:hypothetical protein
MIRFTASLAFPWSGRTLLPGFWLLGAIAHAPFCCAQTEETEQNVINWYYAVEYGTGAYQVGDTTVQILRLPISYTFNEATGRRWGKKLLVPITLGAHEFSYDIRDIIEQVLEEDFVTTTITPGLEWEIPLKERFTLHPYFYAGYGDEITGGNSAWIYGAGLKTQSLDRWGTSAVTYGTALTVAGYSSSDHQDRATTGARLGVNVMSPLPFSIFDKAATWGWHFVGYFYFNEVDFTTSELEPLEISAELELAALIGTRTPVSIFGIGFDRVGLAYRIGDNIKAIRLVGGFPF